MKINLTIKMAIGLAGIALLVFLISFVAIIDSRVTSKLEGVLWTVPAKLYSRPLQIAEGGKININNLLRELEMLSYQQTPLPSKPGEYSFDQNKLAIFLRGFEDQKSSFYQIKFSSNKVASITRQDGVLIDLVMLEPQSIGGMYPAHMEDRLLLDWSQVPQDLVDILLFVEDQTFFQHYGISLKSISRAFFKNIQASDIQQGGSTITQQLAKSLFFSSEQTYKRKIMEAVAALLIEFHYTKKEILLAYLNDVHLAQSGKRSIHGFGLGAQHFFGSSLKNLSTDQLSLLVGMLKGPSLYNPRRNPQKSIERRNIVLTILEREGFIENDKLIEFKKASLRVIKSSFRSESKYPAFQDLVRYELKNNFQDVELRTEGLKILTNIDPVLQEILEDSMSKTKSKLIAKYGDKMQGVQGAAIVVDIVSGEVRALSGSVDGKSVGFNRALNAKRPIGSLVKPFVYLAALNNYRSYNLSSILDDSKLSLPLSPTLFWEPNNFDNKYHGKVPLHVALWQSYNIASARLGLALGYDSVEETFQALGIDEDVPYYPSLFVGAFEMSPIQAIQAYQTIAGDGFYSPLRSIRQIKDIEGNLELGYPYKIEQRFRPEPIYLLKFALGQTFTRGTARGYSKKKITKWHAGGKTGTSNDQRDSWFVGYAGDYLMLVWLGFDDNSPMPITGRTGALQAWKEFMDTVDPVAVGKTELLRIKYSWTDLNDGLLSGKRCKDAILVPFIKGTEPPVSPDKRSRCGL